MSHNSDSTKSVNNDSLSVKSQNVNSVYDLRKNSIYVELGGKGVFGSLNYDRIIPVGEKSGIVLGVTVGFYVGVLPSVNYLYGKSKNFLEVGIGYSITEQIILPLIGYRYQGNKGFLFRVGGMYFQPVQPDSFGDIPMIGLSFGYSF
ncbi:MAG: hypothetical protein C0598_09155 [Marinilabiliales bacterium]|nr:MAG: hypothetical protein C0598_09155 [Marinilabiliales bacterium]